MRSRLQLKLGIAEVKGTYAGTRRSAGGSSAGVVHARVRREGQDEGSAEGRLPSTSSRRVRLPIVECQADVQIGGAVAAVGSRLIGAVARKLTDDFFRRLAEEIGAPAGNDR